MGEEARFQDDTALALGQYWSDDTALAFAGHLVAQAGSSVDPHVGLHLITSSCWCASLPSAKGVYSYNYNYYNNNNYY